MKSALLRITPFLVMPLLLLGCEGDVKSKVGKRIVLPADEVHDGWYFASGDQVTLLGTVDGDVYVAGGEVQIDGVVNGDLLVAGGSVSINGKVSDDIRAAGGNVEFSGSVGKNLTVAGGNIQIAKSAVVGGGIIVAAGEFRIAGSVEKDIVSAGGRGQFGGTVGGNVRFAGGQISTLPGATIQGDLKAMLEDPDRAQIAPGTVNGSVEITKKKAEARGTILGYSTVHFWFKVIWAFSLIITVIVLILLSPRSVEQLGQAIWQRPWWSLLWGFMGIVVTPIVAIALCLTLVGIPLGVFLLAFYGWSLYLSQIALGIVIGQRVFMPESTGRLMLAAIVGIALVQVLTFVPFLGMLIIIAGVLLGIGGIIEVVRQCFGMTTVRMSPPIAQQ
jgi:hypothetical protein